MSDRPETPSELASGCASTIMWGVIILVVVAAMLMLGSVAVPLDAL